MNGLKVLNYDSNEIRMVTMDNEPWWVVRDVCYVLELTNPTMVVKGLDDDEVTKFNLGGLSGETNIVNRSGLYSLILSSRKPEAKKFKRWITHEVLPSIEKHGMYATQDTIERLISDPDTMIKTLQALKAEREQRVIAESIIEEQKPKVIFADAVAVSHTSILVGELAKILKQNGIEFGQNRLFEWLREHGYLIRRKGTDYNMPTQYAMELKLFEIKETVINHSAGYTTVNKTPKITGKGQSYFINKFLAN